MSHPTWVLGTKLWASGKQAVLLATEPPSPAPWEELS